MPYGKPADTAGVEINRGGVCYCVALSERLLLLVQRSVQLSLA